jgi:hypothetical protein
MCDVATFNQRYFQGSSSSGVGEKANYNMYWKNEKEGGGEGRKHPAFNQMDSGFFDQLSCCDR